MASPIVWPQGLVGTGVDSSTLLPDLFSAAVIWVDNSKSASSDANAGTDPELPLKTTSQAVTNASAGSVIVYGANHAETISSTVTVNKNGLRFLGFGVGTRTTFTPASGATLCFSVTTGTDVVFENLYFKGASATSGTAGRVQTAAAGTEIYSCQFDCGANDGNAVICASGGDRFRIDSCSFTATGSRPTSAINLSAAVTGGRIVNTTVDGSTFGWAGTAVSVASCVQLYVKNLTLAGNADMIGATTTSYQLFGVVSSAAGRVTLS